MPIISAQGNTLECATGANLRWVLLQAGVALHNGRSTLINCRGLGTCGTCAVAIEGAASAPNWKEQARLALPPHSPAHPRRLACQTQVLGDVKVTKHEGFWGQGEAVQWSP
ncbi:MAG: (2Fe-2S)-binding protein [Kaiparowitsia implicata GSE-PSE-MK54-09C]|jgi:ferredoxin|nr:(2Fe-2S)-binding protein [Kaiparowitsia implicata GSE-PSE-MK54-09C]